MVEKGLKKGAYFEDAGRIYVVDKVVKEGYISHLATEAEKKALQEKKQTAKEKE